MKNSLKNDPSLRDSFQHDSTSDSTPVYAEFRNRKIPELIKLSDYPTEKLDQFLAKYKVDQESKARARSLNRLDIGIFFDSMQCSLACILPFESSGLDIIFGCLHAALKHLDVTVYCSEKVFEFEKDIVESNSEFFFGFYEGLITDRYVNLSGNYQDKRATGIRCGFALRVKEYFKLNDQLGESALIKNQLLFGNNTSERSAVNKKFAERFYARNIIGSCFKKDDEGDSLWKIFTSIARISLLSNLSESDSEKAVKSNIIPYDELIKRFKRKQLNTFGKNQKAKAESIKDKKPVFPKKSPLYTSGEMSLWNDYISPMNSIESEIRENYFDTILVSGFTNTSDRIGNLFQRQWNAISTFSAATTKRLQDIRKLSPDADKIRKNQVTVIQVQKILQNGDFSSSKICREVTKIKLSMAEQAEIQTLKWGFSDDTSFAVALHNQAEKIYRIELPDQFKCAAPVIKMASAKLSKDFQSAMRIVKDSRIHLASLNLKCFGLNKLQHVSKDLVGSLPNIINAMAHLKKLRSEWLMLDECARVSINSARGSLRYELPASLYESGSLSKLKVALTTLVDDNFIKNHLAAVQRTSVTSKRIAINDIILVIERLQD